MLKRWTNSEMMILQDTTKNILELQSLLPQRSMESIRIKAGRLGHLRTGDALLRNSSNYIELLKGLKPTMSNDRGTYYVLHFFGKHALGFLEYIGSCPVESLNYRWDTKGYAIYDKVCRCGNKFTSSGFVESWKKYCSSQCKQKFKRRKK